MEADAAEAHVMETMSDTLRTSILAAGIALAGLLAGAGVERSRTGDRFVTVKGVAEQEVRADVAIWPLQVTGADNDLATASRKLAASVDGVRRFLARHGIDTTQVEFTGFTVNDAQANPYGGEQRTSNRFVVRQTLLVRSGKPDLVLSASQQISELAAAGVVISSGGEFGPGGPTFVFTGLNGIKPKMIADATERAREAAEQFARDSRSTLGGIRRANQGVFEILARDQAPGVNADGQIAKVVRVVATVEYALR